MIAQPGSGKHWEDLQLWILSRWTDSCNCIDDTKGNKWPRWSSSNLTSFANSSYANMWMGGRGFASFKHLLDSFRTDGEKRMQSCEERRLSTWRSEWAAQEPAASWWWEPPAASPQAKTTGKAAPRPPSSAFKLVTDVFDQFPGTIFLMSCFLVWQTATGGSSCKGTLLGLMAFLCSFSHQATHDQLIKKVLNNKDLNVSEI